MYSMGTPPKFAANDLQQQQQQQPPDRSTVNKLTQARLTRRLCWPALAVLPTSALIHPSPFTSNPVHSPFISCLGGGRLPAHLSVGSGLWLQLAGSPVASSLVFIQSMNRMVCRSTGRGRGAGGEGGAALCSSSPSTEWGCPAPTEPHMC